MKTDRIDDFLKTTDGVPLGAWIMMLKIVKHYTNKKKYRLDKPRHYVCLK